MKGNFCYPAKTIFAVGSCFLFAVFTVAAQSPEREKPRLKDFGSSLKQLKWDPEKNTAVEIKPAENTGEEDVVRVQTELVVCDVQVSDSRGRPVEGLTRNDFIMTEDGRPQQIDTFTLGDSAQVSRSIVLIIDYSPSQLPYLKTSVEAAKILVDKLNPNDRMAIVTDDVELIEDFTRNKDELKSKLESLENKAEAAVTASRQPGSARLPLGRSAQYSALMATLRELFDSEDLRPIIIFQTDGDELSLLHGSDIGIFNGLAFNPGMREQARRNAENWQKYHDANVKEFSLEDVYKTAEKSRATIYTVISGLRFLGLSADQQIERLKAIDEKSFTVWLSANRNIDPRAKESIENLHKQLPVEFLKAKADYGLKLQTALAGAADITGGWTDFLETPSQADAIYSRIFSDINRRYIIGYYPANEIHDGKRRRIKIEVIGHPEYDISGRKSYYAAASEK